ncbi:hypothetical protein ACOI92_13955, partial [Corynebacterium striatum]|uniref:hypothetical protein n=1 Tax=Corynebacterium striatum TaxID=43770 RepID=UPI003B5CAD40
VLRQDAILHQANDAVLRILIKFSWHVPDFPIYSNGTKPGTLHPPQGGQFDFSDRRPRALGMNQFRLVETVDCFG